MSCTCETYGHCVVCRSHADTHHSRLRDNCERGAHSFAEVSSTGWEICEFCGARRHPERLAAAQKAREEVQPRYRVQFSVFVDAENVDHAKNIIPFELKKLPRLEFERTVLTQRINNK